MLFCLESCENHDAQVIQNRAALIGTTFALKLALEPLKKVYVYSVNVFRM